MPKNSPNNPRTKLNPGLRTNQTRPGHEIGYSFTTSVVKPKHPAGNPRRRSARETGKNFNFLISGVDVLEELLSPTRRGTTERIPASD